MSMADGSMETLFQEKLMCYHKLVELVKNEKKQIVEADVTALWQMSAKKQALVAEILSIRGRILEAATARSIDHGMTSGNFQALRFLSLLPAEDRRRLSGFQSSLLALKKQIQGICRDNKRYIESKLGMIDELMAIITGQKTQGREYGSESAGAGYGRPMLIRRQV